MITVDDIIRAMEGADLPSIPDGVKPDVPLVHQGFDSLDLATLMLTLEGQFKKTIPVESTQRLRTLEDIAAFLNA